jgi:hypothetical protein
MTYPYGTFSTLTLPPDIVAVEPAENFQTLRTGIRDWRMSP